MDHNHAWDNVPKKLIWYKDCTEPLTESDFEIGESRVITAAFGTYRETGTVDDNRFGYRFDVKRTDRPHLLEITFPDDKERTMCFGDGVCYDLNCSVVVGGDQANTGTMRRVCNVFWPRALDQSILISSFSGKKPAAAASIAVYELESLPASPISDESYPTRTFGIQYEDPCNIGASEGAYATQDWTERHIDYMHLTGQNRLVYPINWYHGPNIPVQSQPGNRWNGLVLAENGSRAFYGRSVTGDFPDWLDGLLTRFDAEGLHFTGSMTLMRLGRLIGMMNTDETAVRAGADTVCNVLYDGTVQNSTNDWTTEYDYYPTTEIGEWGKPQTPIFNPLHPTVRAQIKEYLGEVARRYAHHPSFEGFSINLWHGTMLWFGNLLAGYDDICATRFTEDTGIVIPAAQDDPHRFEKRYAFLTEHAKEAWIAWRCSIVKEFLCEIRDMLREIRPDYHLGVTVWNEPAGNGYWHGREGIPSRSSEESQFAVGPTNEELYRYAGMDFSMYGGEDGISFTVERNFGRDKTQWNTDDDVISRSLTDPVWLEEDMYAKLRANNNTEGFHFDCWVERWGKHSRVPCDDTDKNNIEKIRAMPDYKATQIHKTHTVYADDPDRRFFYDAQLRITSLLPDAPYYSEQITADLALHDALSVTAGGLYLDKSHAMEQLAFAKEYRRLPAKRFSDVPGFTDPVCLRYLCETDTTWVYALSREPYEITVSFVCGDRTETFILAPFALKTFRYAFAAVPTAVTVTLPSDVRETYLDDAKKTLALLDSCRDAGEIFCRGIDITSERIRAAADAEHFSELRHLLQSYVVKATHLNYIKLEKN